MKKKITPEQRSQWSKDGRCHVCGSNVNNHMHPTWMWLANPLPIPEGFDEYRESEEGRKFEKELREKERFILRQINETLDKKRNPNSKTV